ncbi:MAG: fibronectin type III domain-containing protein, partial [Gammaproteobacteria bacterium]
MENQISRIRFCGNGGRSFFVSAGGGAGCCASDTQPAAECARNRRLTQRTPRNLGRADQSAQPDIAYIVEARVAASIRYTHRSFTDNTTFTIAHLRAGTTYEVRVATRYVVGISDKTYFDWAYTPEPGATAVTLAASIPSAPRWARARSNGDEGIKVEWQLPKSDGGAPITSFRLRWKLRDGVYAPGDTITFDVHDTRARIYYDYFIFDIPNLTLHSIYTAQVAAVNAVGTGPYSEMSDARVEQMLVHPTITTAGIGELRVNWKAPKTPLKQYSLWWSPLIATPGGDPEETVTISQPKAPGESETYLISGLIGGIDYKVRIGGVTIYSKRGGARIHEERALIGRPLALSPPPPYGKPQQVVVTPADSALHIAWKPTHAKVDYSYKVHWKPADDSIAPSTVTLFPKRKHIAVCVTWVCTADFTHTITGLTNGNTYVVKVAAVNAGVTGTYSEERTGTPVAPSSRVSPPQNVRATAGDGEIRIEWDAPLLDNGARLTGYRVRWKRMRWMPTITDRSREIQLTASDFVDANSGGNGGTYTITNLGLNAGVTFEVQVAATNGANISAYSAPLFLASRPFKPRSLDLYNGIRTNVRAVNAGEIHASWRGPSYETGYRSLYGFLLRWKPETAATFAPDDSVWRGYYQDYVITGLDGDTVYDVQVASRVRGVLSEYISGSITPARLNPNPPQNVRAVSIDNAGFRVTWDPPADGPKPRGYTLRSKRSFDEHFITSRHVYTDTTYSSTGWTPGTTHLFQVAALDNDHGMSEYAPTPPASVVIVAGLPDAPRNIRARAGNRRLHISWLPGRVRDPKVTEYRLRWKPRGGVYTPAA